MKDRRQSRRHPVELPVSIRGPNEEIIGNTVDISRHGLFIKTNLEKAEGELTQLWVKSPEGTWIQLMAIAVRHSVDLGGLGLRLYMIGGQEKVHWEQLLERFETAPQQSNPQRNSADNLARFFVRPRSVQQLDKFAGRELRLGGLFFRTPVPRCFGEYIELMVIHPITDNAFAITGQVIVSLKEGLMSERGNGIFFDGNRKALIERFNDFCSDEALHFVA